MTEENGKTASWERREQENDSPALSKGAIGTEPVTSPVSQETRGGGFAVWITGLPASGKSTLALALTHRLREMGVEVEHLDSDAVRRVVTPQPTYSQAERDRFYECLLFMGQLLLRHGVAVIFDATGHLRRFRDEARQRIPRFLEVFVDCPLNVCRERDPKGIYLKGSLGESGTVPGLQEPYEPPLNPELVVRGDCDDPQEAADKVLDRLIVSGFC